MSRKSRRFAFALLLIAAMPALAAAQPGRPWQHDSPVTFVRFLDSGKQLLTASQDGSFRIWEAATGKELRRFGTALTPKTLGPSIAALAPDGQLLAVVTQEGRIRLWDTATGKAYRTLELNEANKAGVFGAVSAAFSPDGKILAIRSKDQMIHLVSIATGRRLQSFGNASTLRPFHGNFFAGGAGSDNSLAFVSDNLSLFAVHVTKDDMRQQGVVRLWGIGVLKGKELLQSKFRLNNPFLDARTGFGVASLAFGADDKTLLAWASSDGTARLFDVVAEKEMRRLPAVQQGVYVAFVFSPDAKTLAMRTSNSTAIRLHDVATGKELHVLGDPAVTPNKKWAGDAQTLAFSPDGRLLAEGFANTVRVWDVASGKEITRPRGE